jgi:hypothetical protein
LPRIDIADLCRFRVFPPMTNWRARYSLEMPFRYPFVKNLVICPQSIEANHLPGHTQPIKLRWCRTGFGGNYRPRPLFVCQCGRSVTKLYFRHFNLACRRCTNALYASQVCGKHSRPILKTLRLENLLKLKSYMGNRNRQRLIARIPKTPTKRLDGKRLSHHSIQLPQSNYRTRGAMHWR